jgi:hypothetical protein
MLSQPADGLDDRSELICGELNAGAPGIRSRNNLPPVGVVAVDFASDEPPPSAGQLHVRRRPFWVLLALLLLALNPIRFMISV